MSGFRVKYQEAGGSILANAFEKDLGSGQHCGRAACPPCQIPGERGNCKKKNVVYESCCEVCNPVSNHQEDQDHPPGRAKTPREGVYIGETSRTLHERALEHVNDARSFSTKSHIIKHWMTTHPDLPSPPTMIFSVKAQYRDCLSRQIGEALRINFTKDTILNSKNEYLSNTVSRLTIEEDAWERRERSRQEEEQEELLKRSVEEFRVLKTAPNILPGGSSLDTTPSVPVTLDVPCEKSRNTAKQDLLVQTTCQPGLNYDTDEDEFGGDEGDGKTEVDTEVKEMEARYETDEEEFSREDTLGILPGGNRPDTTPAFPAVPKQQQGTLKRKNTAKRNVTAPPRISKRPTRNRDYSLGYFNLWWSRMEREGLKEERERLLKLKKDVNMERLRSMMEDRRLQNGKRKRLALKSEVDDSRMNPSDGVKDETIQEWTQKVTTIDPDPMRHSEYLMGGGIRIPGGNTMEGVERGLVHSDGSIYERSQRFQNEETLFLDGTRDGVTTGYLNLVPNSDAEEGLPVSSYEK